MKRRELIEHGVRAGGGLAAAGLAFLPPAAAAGPPDPVPPKDWRWQSYVKVRRMLRLESEPDGEWTIVSDGIGWGVLPERVERLHFGQGGLFLRTGTETHCTWWSLGCVNPIETVRQVTAEGEKLLSLTLHVVASPPKGQDVGCDPSAARMLRRTLGLEEEGRLG